MTDQEQGADLVPLERLRTLLLRAPHGSDTEKVIVEAINNRRAARAPGWNLLPRMTSLEAREALRGFWDGVVKTRRTMIICGMVWHVYEDPNMPEDELRVVQRPRRP